MKPSPKGALAVLALGTKPRKTLDSEPELDDEEPDEGDDDAHGAAFDTLARILSVPDAKRAAFQAALKSYVRSCK